MKIVIFLFPARQHRDLNTSELPNHHILLRAYFSVFSLSFCKHWSIEAWILIASFLLVPLHSLSWANLVDLVAQQNFSLVNLLPIMIYHSKSLLKRCSQFHLKLPFLVLNCWTQTCSFSWISYLTYVTCNCFSTGLHHKSKASIHRGTKDITWVMEKLLCTVIGHSRNPDCDDWIFCSTTRKVF